MSRRRGLALAAVATILTVGLILAYGRFSDRLWNVLHPGPLPAVLALVAFATVEVALVLALLGRFDPSALGRSASAGEGLRRWLVRGIAIGLIANALGPAVLSVMGMAWLSPAPTASAKMIAFAALWVPVSAVWEELVFRGCILRWLRPCGTVTALTVSSLLFAGAHFLAEPLFPSRLLLLIAFGILLGTAYLASRSLWFAVGIHLGINIIGFLLAEGPISGGLWRISISLPQSTFAAFLLSGVVVATGLAVLLAKGILSRRRSA